MGSNCCGDYVAASPEMVVTESESIALILLCVVFIILFYGSIFLLCFMMYPKIRADLYIICLEDFEVNNVVRVLVGCKHVFHVQCIDSWCFYKLMCSVCRAPFQ
ncbi:hypothetical protein EUTSA_v10023843mg [Eutrema salsugineum]|uniref:RING-type domain-containing protein n=1 Tax=Eutrema salsugineum TaxID=72664 RepID=V4KDY5_EUTSA|nr:hypothetical protein EUTSA_v10023843mg [Eutrema salsugineum]